MQYLAEYSDSEEDRHTANVLINTGKRSLPQLPEEENLAEKPLKRTVHEEGVAPVKSVITGAELPLLPDDLFRGIEATAEIAQRKDFHGKVRSFAHKEGDFATFVFLPLAVAPDDALFAVLESLFAQEAKQFPSENPLKRQEEYHISLSRTFSIRYLDIKPFVEHLENGLRGFRSFEIEFHAYEYFTNDEKTRSFVGLCLEPNARDQVINLIKRVDQTMTAFHKQLYYKDPIPHVSFGWALGDILPSLPVRAGEIGRSVKWSVTQAAVKVGKVKYTFPFAK